MDANVIENRINDIINFTAKYDKIYIYGAGKYAHALNAVLCEFGVQISGFCVTRCSSADVNNIKDKNVMPFADARNNVNCCFLLAMKKQYQYEVIRNFSNIAINVPYYEIDEIFLRAAADYEVNRLCYETASFHNILEYRRNVDRIAAKDSLLITRRTAMGDVLALTSVLKKLREFVNIPVCVSTKWTEVYKYNNVADMVFRYDVVPPEISGVAFGIDLHDTHERNPFRHMIDGYVRCLQEIFPDFAFNDCEKTPIYDDKLIRKRKGKVRAICINNEASGWKGRIYPPERMKRFASWLKKSGYALYEIGSDRSNYLGVGQDCFGLKLHDTVKLMAETDLYIGLDNGLMHMAQAIRLPMFVLFGCTCPNFRIYDWSIARVMWKNTNELDCSGCYHRQQMPCSLPVCIREDYACMNWSVEEVIYAFKNLQYGAPPLLNVSIRKPVQFLHIG